MPVGLIWALMCAIKDLDDLEATPIVDEAGAFGPNSPDTSRTAAAMAKPRSGSVRRRIVDEIRISEARRDPWVGGLTDDELELITLRKHTTISAARNSLVEAGWLEDSSYRRDTTSGRPAIVWCLTPAARTAIWHTQER